MAGVEDFFSGVLGAMNTAYNLFTNQRDFDYQKALQQQIFQREDTAVQRRMADLKAAGINPNLAAGSAANAGAVVGRSSTNDVNMGSALDTIMAVRQLAMQKDQAQILKAQRTQENNNTLMSNINLALATGRGYSLKPIFEKDGTINWQQRWNEGTRDIKSMPYYNLYKNDYEYQMAQKQALDYNNDYLNKQLQWYTFDKVMNNLHSLVGDVGVFTPKLSRRLK